ncbi:hypothetical protein AX774_g3971 [Zancudomyces culisetae]|uniref:Uncharacterized protein n=1 Tax=Zancudomyces culisetae TaxID=1213189 RepID=A0A1R1PNK0_ZANCU|nr:hypothetical protein AX774_g3971 [Zancudomyces culisetae]|eukprot:OMH82547.1 hypothetical protein AX774_g3971 [Zancudomyces culisetae]
MDNGRHFGCSTPKKQPSLYGHRRLSFKLLENTSKGREFSRLISTLANKSNTKFSPSNDDKSNHGKNDKGDFEPFENKIYLKNQLSENPQQEKSTENIFSVDKTEGRVNGTGCHNTQETTNLTFVPDLQDNAGLKDINKETTITKRQAGVEKKVANSIKETVNCHTSIDPEKPPPLISPAFTNYDTTNKILKKTGERAFSDSKKTALFERKYGENNLPNWPDIAIWKVRENDLMWMPECLSDDEYIIEGTTENNELEKRKEKACVGPPSEESDLTGVNNRASRLFKLKNNLYKHYAGLKKLNRRRSTGILEKGITLNLRVKGKETLNTRGRSIHLYNFNCGSNTPTRSTRLNTVVSGRRLGLDTKNRKLHRTKGQKLFYYGHDQANCTMNVNKLPATLVIESPTTSKLQKRSSHTYGARSKSKSNSNSNSTRHISMVHGKDIASETVVGMDMSVNSEFDINTGSGCSVWHSQAISTEANEPDDDKLAIPASYKQTEKSTNASSNKEDRYESDDWNQDECKNEKPHLRASETSESRLTIEEMKRMLFMGDVSNDIAECSYELLRKMQDTVFCKTIYQNTNDSTGLFNAIRSALAKQSTSNYQSKKYASTTIHFLYVVFLTLSFKHNPEFTYSLLLDHRVFEQIVEMFHLSTSSEGQEMSRLSRQVMVNNGIVFSIEASSTISLDFLSLYFINSVIQDQAPAAVALSSMIKSELYKSGTISAVFELMLTKWVSEWLDHVSSLQCFWDPHQHSFYRINDNLLIILQMSFRVLQYGIHFNCLDVNSTSVEAQSAILLNLLDTTEYLIMHSIEKHSDHFFGKDKHRLNNPTSLRL